VNGNLEPKIEIVYEDEDRLNFSCGCQIEVIGSNLLVNIGFHKEEEKR
jgi:hypothetical protein